MRFSNHHSQVFAVTRPVRGGTLTGMGEEYDDWGGSTDPWADYSGPSAEQVYTEWGVPTPPAVAEAAPAEKPTDWMGIFNTSAKALASITPAVTGIIGMKYQSDAQKAANDLALSQARLAAQRRVVNVGPASGGMPTWIVPAALGGVALLAVGFFLTRMPRSRPAASPVATNPRKRR